jgi:acid stress chaperone HdeA
MAVAASVVALVSGCSGGVNNNGGDTICKDFLVMSDDDKNATAAKMLKERDGRNASTGDVMAERVILVGFCQRPDKQNAKISDVA